MFQKLILALFMTLRACLNENALKLKQLQRYERHFHYRYTFAENFIKEKTGSGCSNFCDNAKNKKISSFVIDFSIRLYEQLK
jgi:hypothetical protein